MNARRDGAWLVGETAGFTEFTVVEHAEVFTPRKDDTGGGWHVRRSESPTTICGIAVADDLEHKRALYTECWQCGMALFESGHAYWLPWSVLDILESEYWKRRPAPATMITADA
jgi:hypothetical protein